MKHSTFGAALVALALLLPSLATARIALAPIMQRWHKAQLLMDTMLLENRSYDPVAVRAALQLYAADALIASVNVEGTSAARRDFAARFAQFAQDAKSAEATVTSLATLRPHIHRLNGECQACHAIYNS